MVRQGPAKLRHVERIAHNQGPSNWTVQLQMSPASLWPTPWLLDSATARELNLATTGHAQRGVSSPPSPGPTNLHIEPGPRSPDELIADISDGFYVTELIGSGVNPVTGDYSRGASGFWIENGRRSYPVSEVTIAGNLITIFGALEPANDLEFRYGTNAPTVRIEGLTVAGR